MVRFALVTAILVCACPVAHAQELAVAPPIAAATSGEPSLQSGRTLGTGEVLIAGAAGWPWIWAQVEFALDSGFNLGIRPAILFGSPYMALEPGVGGELAIPMRIHLWGEDTIDMAIFVTPAAVVAEAAAVGQGGTTYAGQLGWGARLEAGLVLGWRLSDDATLILGAGGHVGFSHTPAASHLAGLGAVMARLGIEGLISRDTMLFAVADGGLGFSSGGVAGPLFRESFPPLLRVSLGVGYLL